MDPGAGRVLLDDVDLKTFAVDSVRGCVALSLQRTSLFGESIRENLLLGAPEASDEDIWRALEAADARGFVESLPDGLDSELGTSGAGLSGGQESRLSLARTLLRSASILIVDEPFAGLDRIASKHVSDTLHELARDRIVVVIAHDLERLDYYDTICFMDEGRKVAQGSHSELLEALPLYREVVRSTAEVS
jgi:ABC-type multidrug transport system fused ATPase/permease subunit